MESESNKLCNFHIVKEIILLFFLLICLSNCSDSNDNLLHIQNCYSGSAEVIIEFEEKRIIKPELLELIKDHKLRLHLEYPEVKSVFIKTSMDELRKGFPFEKMTIIKSTGTTVINRGDSILEMMDVDLIGDIAKSPFIICI